LSGAVKPARALTYAVTPRVVKTEFAAARDYSRWSPGVRGTGHEHQAPGRGSYRPSPVSHSAGCDIRPCQQWPPPIRCLAVDHAACVDTDQ